MPSPEFQEAAKTVEAMVTAEILTKSDPIMREIYGLYKQATEGDNNNPEPQRSFSSSIPFTEAFMKKQKWEAWKALEGKSKEDAEKEYIALVEKIKQEKGFEG